MDMLAPLLQAARRHRRSGHLADAEAVCRQIMARDPSRADFHFELGEVYRTLGRYPDADRCYRESLRLDPDYPAALNNLGTLLLHRGALDESRTLLERAVRLRPDYPLAHNNLGSVWLRLGRPAAAQACFAQALLLQPDLAVARYNLGTALHQQGRYAEAEDSLRRALLLEPDYAPAHYQLGVVLKDRSEHIDSENHLGRAVGLEPEFVEAWSVLAHVLALQGKAAEAHAAMDRALALDSGDALKLRAALLLPALYASRDALEHERQRLETGLARLEDASLAIDDPAVAVGMTPFYLAYQGKNDRRLLERLAALYRKACPGLGDTAPHCRAGRPRRSSCRPIRIGFVSIFFYRHSVGKLNLGFVRNLTRGRFEVTLFRFPGPDDEMARAFERGADRVLPLPRRLEDARRQIAAEELDVLYYADLGMDPLTYFLAFARLAPVQCVAWGHPATSGIPTIDYFLSSVHLEPDDGADHYTEGLVRFPRINTFYDEPRIDGPPKQRTELGLPEGPNLYVCTQSLFKVHPDFDAVLGAILRGDPAGRLVFIDGICPSWKELLLERFRRSFPAEAGRVDFIPRLSQDDFLHLQARADVLLDTIHSGGGNTSYEALAFGTPIVTRDGRHLRDRITAACYRQMGLPECVATTDEDYVRMALALGTDPARRDRLRARILARKQQLFEDPLAVRQLEQFLEEAVGRARATPLP